MFPSSFPVIPVRSRTPILKRQSFRTFRRKSRPRHIISGSYICGDSSVCHPFKTAPEPKKNIRSSQSFGEPVTSIIHLREAVASFMERACETLRGQRSTAECVSVFIATSPHRDVPQYANAASRRLSSASDCTPTLLTAAFECLDEVFVPGPQYIKVGVCLSDLCSAMTRQNCLFDAAQTKRDVRLMAAVDRINGDLGRGRISVAATGRWKARPWDMKQNCRSPRYTTRWEDLAGVRSTGKGKLPCRS